MAIGDHFFSHTVVTMLLAWLIIRLIASIDSYLADNPVFSREVENSTNAATQTNSI